MQKNSCIEREGLSSRESRMNDTLRKEEQKMQIPGIEKGRMMQSELDMDGEVRLF